MRDMTDFLRWAKTATRQDLEQSYQFCCYFLPRLIVTSLKPDDVRPLAQFMIICQGELERRRVMPGNSVRQGMGERDK